MKLYMSDKVILDFEKNLNNRVHLQVDDGSETWKRLSYQARLLEIKTIMD
jgi:hypothetical protein